MKEQGDYERSMSSAPGSYDEMEFGKNFGAYVRQGAIGSAPYLLEAAATAPLLGATSLARGASAAGVRALGERAAVSAYEKAMATASAEQIASGMAHEVATRMAMEASEQAVRTGARSIGLGVGSYPSSVGDILSNQHEENGTYNLGAAAGLGVPYAAANLMGVEGMAARGLSGLAKGGVGRGLMAAGETVLGEAGNETFQEGMNQFGRMSVNPNQTFWNDESAARFKESAIMGGLVGGLGGSAHIASAAMRPRLDETGQRATDLLEATHQQWLGNAEGYKQDLVSRIESVPQEEFAGVNPVQQYLAELNRPRQVETVQAGPNQVQIPGHTFNPVTGTYTLQPEAPQVGRVRQGLQADLGLQGGAGTTQGYINFGQQQTPDNTPLNPTNINDFITQGLDIGQQMGRAIRVYEEATAAGQHDVAQQAVYHINRLEKIAERDTYGQMALGFGKTENEGQAELPLYFDPYKPGSKAAPKSAATKAAKRPKNLPKDQTTEATVPPPAAGVSARNPQGLNPNAAQAAEAPVPPVQEEAQPDQPVQGAVNVSSESVRPGSAPEGQESAQRADAQTQDAGSTEIQGVAVGEDGKGKVTPESILSAEAMADMAASAEADKKLQSARAKFDKLNNSLAVDDPKVEKARQALKVAEANADAARAKANSHFEPQDKPVARTPEEYEAEDRAPAANISDVNKSRVYLRKAVNQAKEINKKWERHELSKGAARKLMDDAVEAQAHAVMHLMDTVNHGTSRDIGRVTTKAAAEAQRVLDVLKADIHPEAWAEAERREQLILKREMAVAKQGEGDLYSGRSKRVVDNEKRANNKTAREMDNKLKEEADRKRAEEQADLEEEARSANKQTVELDENDAYAEEDADVVRAERWDAGVDSVAHISRADILNDPDPTEATSLEAAFKGKTVHEVAAHIATNAPDPSYRKIAERVATLLKKFEAAGTKFTFHIAHVGTPVPRALTSARGITHYVYDPKRGSEMNVWVNGPDVTGKVGTSWETTLHELVHAVTMQAVRLGNQKRAQGTDVSNAVVDLFAVLNTAISHFNQRAKDFKAGKANLTDFEQAVFRGEINSIHSADEMLTWALTNKAMQEWLESIPYKSKNLFTAFVESIRKLLGLTPKADTALSEVLRVADTLLDDNIATLRPIASASGTTLHQTTVYEQYSQHAADYAEKVSGSLGRLAVVDATRLTKKLTGSMMFLSDLVNKVEKHMPAARKWYDAYLAKQASRFERERKADDIASMASKLDNESFNKVNKFLKQSTFEQKWGYQPDWLKRTVKVDQATAARWHAMTKQERAVADAVFKHGEDYINELRALFDKLGGASVLDRFGKLNGPYAPLKRFGDFVAVGKSKELIAAEAAYEQDQSAQNAKKVDELKSNIDHFISSRFSTMGQADAFVQKIKGDYEQAYPFEAPKQVTNDNASEYRVLKEVLSAIEVEKMPDDAKRVMKETIRDLYLNAAGEFAARQSQHTRKFRHGADDNMIQSFLTSAKANAVFMSNLEHGGSINDAFYQMQKQVGGTREFQDDFNLLSEHYADSLQYKPTPIQDAITGLTSAWQLSTSIGYHITNATQPIMVSLPKLAADFNDYGGAWKALLNGYSMFKTLSSGLQVDLSKIKNEGLRRALEHNANLGLMDVGIEEDLTQFDHTRTGYKAVDGLTGLGAAAMHKLRQVSRYVEMLNRVAASVAAYNMATQHGMSEAQATKYVTDTLSSTQGDFSRLGAPLILKKLPKPMVQYRKFQFLMGAFYVKAFHQAFLNADPTERAIGRRMLTYKLAHTGVAAGALGMPLMNIAAMVFAATGGDDEKRDLEQSLRNAIGNKDVADLLLRGPLALIGVDMSAKLGDDKIFSIMPYSNWDFSSSKAALQTVGSLVGGPSVAQAGKVLDGLAYMKDGQWLRGVEMTMPKGISNAMQSFRLANEGYQLKNGDVLVKPEDISAFALVLNGMGLPATQIKDIQRVRGLQFEVEKFYTERQKEIEHDYARAAKEGDTATMKELRDEWVALQNGKAEWKPVFNNSKDFLKKQPLSNLLKYPQTVNKRESKTQRSFALEQ
jgi:hypothetical protein